MKSSAVVTGIDGSDCLLTTERREACKNCGANCVGCGKVITVRAENTLGAEIGDEVELYSSSSSFLILSALIFLLPILAALAALLIANALWGMKLGGIIALMIFLLSLGGGVLIARKDKAKLSLKMIRIIKKGES